MESVSVAILLVAVGEQMRAGYAIYTRACASANYAIGSAI